MPGRTRRETNFYGYDFLVTEDVLTPRPETEQLIDAVLDLCGKPYLPGVKPNKPVLDPKNLKILDVGTGSGCIAITLKKELPEADLYASDISEKALEVAQKNAHRHHTPITFIISHLLENVKLAGDTLGGGPPPFSLRGRGRRARQDPPNISDFFDLIIANLPYVDQNWDWLDKESLKDDPDLALYAEDGGLALIKELIKTANSPYLILEADPSQHNRIIDYAKDNYKIISQRGFILTFMSKF